MTAKRFTITQDFEEHHRQIRDNGKIIMGCFVEPQAEPIVKLLNELHEENKELKFQLDECRTHKLFSRRELEKENEQLKSFNQDLSENLSVCADKRLAQGEHLTKLTNENEQLTQELNKLKKFEYGGEHIRLSINIETGELQRHIYATGQWFGDFDRVLVDNWLSKEDYQRFINRVIEVYNTEFKKEIIE